jgi:sensor histidine kinase regulating citrate/malate metabolism
MARTAEQVVKEIMGQNALQIATLISENENLKEELAKMKEDAEKLILDKIGEEMKKQDAEQTV